MFIDPGDAMTYGVCCRHSITGLLYSLVVYHNACIAYLYQVLVVQTVFSVPGIITIVTLESIRYLLPDPVRKHGCLNQSSYYDSRTVIAER